MTDTWFSVLDVWLSRVMASDTPLLPTLFAQQLWLSVAWTIVLAWVVPSIIVFFTKSKHWLALGLCVVVIGSGLPRTFTAPYWLGMAFQAPSLVTVCLCVVGIFRLVYASAPDQAQGRGSNVLMVLAIAMGWALLLDTLAMLPGVQLYALGFSSLAPALVLFVVFMCCLGRRNRISDWLVIVVVVLVFMTLHLPTGNLWDAVMDPWLWLILQLRALRIFIRR
jgi:hypothetical protein